MVSEMCTRTISFSVGKSLGFRKFTHIILDYNEFPYFISTSNCPVSMSSSMIQTKGEPIGLLPEVDRAQPLFKVKSRPSPQDYEIPIRFFPYSHLNNDYSIKWEFGAVPWLKDISGKRALE